MQETQTWPWHTVPEKTSLEEQREKGQDAGRPWQTGASAPDPALVELAHEGEWQFVWQRTGESPC